MDSGGDEEVRGHGLGAQLSVGPEFERAVQQGPDAQGRAQFGRVVGEEEEDDGRDRNDGLTVDRGAHVQRRAHGLEDQDQSEEDEVANGEVVDNLGRQAQLGGIDGIAGPEDGDDAERDA